MKVNVEELSPVLKRVSVEVPPEDVDRALTKAYRTVNRSAKIPGFRPGKVPRWMLERHYGPQVAMQVAEDLVRESFPKVVEQEDLRAVGTPSVEEVGEVAVGKPFEYKAKVDVLPEPKVTEFEGLPAEKLKVEVAGEDVDAELERIRKSFAKLVPVEDRTKVESGDFVVAEVSATADGEPFDTGTSEGVTLEVSSGSISEGHIPEAEGHEVGEVVTTSYDFPEEERVPEHLRGKTGEFKVTIKEIKRREVPPIDDELAKDLGEEGVDTLLALRGMIREKLTERKTQEVELHFTDSLMKALVERNPIDVPSSLVEQAAYSMVQPFLQQLARSGAGAGEFGSEEMLGRLIETSKPRAESSLKSTMLLKAVADKLDIEVTDEDLVEFYEKTAQESDTAAEKIKARTERNPEEIEGAKRRIREQKALAHLKEKASIKEVEGGRQPEGETEPKGEEASPAEDEPSPAPSS